MRQGVEGGPDVDHTFLKEVVKRKNRILWVRANREREAKATLVIGRQSWAVVVVLVRRVSSGLSLLRFGELPSFFSRATAPNKFLRLPPPAARAGGLVCLSSSR